jgi:hypothetical protein
MLVLFLFSMPVPFLKFLRANQTENAGFVAAISEADPGSLRWAGGMIERRHLIHAWRR